MSADPQYVVELFDFYAPLYDQHMKEGLLYTAPRILRQEVRSVFNRTLLATPPPPMQSELRGWLEWGVGWVGWMLEAGRSLLVAAPVSQ